MAARNELSGVVRRLCLWCQGDSWKLVDECDQLSCALHGIRLERDVDAPLAQSCLVAHCLQCAGSSEAVEECAADQPYAGHLPCPAHAFRRPGRAVPVQHIATLPGLAPADMAEKAGEETAGGAQDGSGAVKPRTQPVAGCRPQSCVSALRVNRDPEALDI